MHIKYLIIVFSICFTNAYSQKLVENRWKKVDSNIVFKRISPKEIGNYNFKNDSISTVIYAKEKNIYYGIVLNMVEGSSSYFILDKRYIVYVITSPFLEYPNSVKKILNNAHTCYISDRKSIKYIEFSFISSQRKSYQMGTYKKEDNKCFRSFSLVPDTINSELFKNFSYKNFNALIIFFKNHSKNESQFKEIECDSPMWSNILYGK